MNVLIYMSDEHNPAFSSVYGHPYIQTPNMQRLAAMGTTYSSAYCNSPICHPSRSSFMAGKYAHELQVYNNCNAFSRDDPSYGQLLSSQNIHTAYIGKTDVYNHSSTLGFDEMLLPGDRKAPGDRNISRKPPMGRKGAHLRADNYGPHDAPFDKDEKKIAQAIEWLTQRSPSINKPWSLTVNTTSPHFPHFVTQELWDMYPQGGDLPDYGPDQPTANHPAARHLRDYFETDLFSEEHVRGLRRGYLGCVTQVDRYLGRLLEALEASGQLEDTLIVYTSDHGEMLGQFGMWWKCSLYEDSVRVPLIVAGPGFEKGSTIDTPVSLLDLQATIFKALGANRPAELRGQPLQDIRQGDDSRVVLSEYQGHGSEKSAFMIRQGPWKLIFHAGHPHQLFNLRDDPHELTDLAASHPQKRDELIAELYKLCDPMVEHERCSAQVDRQLEHIASLGS